MSDISTLKEKINTKTFHLFLLCIVTLGLYPLIWLYKASTAVEETTHIKVMSMTFLIGYLVLLGVGCVVAMFVSLFIPGLVLLWNVSILLVQIVWCFRVRRAIRAYTLTEHNFEPRINRVFSVLFTFYHINYCINALPNDKQKHERKQQLTDNSVEA
ncbi:hypothetical protein [Pseudomonas sp. PD9R]|uniref:hypothetical protein n=1 Tax=Pseudomonas sp. PD9R TaxID=2853534 RepID=UPI001C461447|nr:hypothetical protein [Pseudomonas sp. PD9R]MBV6822373.1 hypothetical protein [Pseudomonas sp. PD9R]